MERKTNQGGITYLSILFALSILMMLLPFFPFIYQSIEPKNYQEEISIDQFFRFIQDETELAVRTTVTPNLLTFYYPDGTKVQISPYQHLIRRQLNGQGYEVLLRNIKTVIFEEVSYGLEIKIQTLSGEYYGKKIYNPSTS